jgi:hypothetical protein
MTKEQAREYATRIRLGEPMWYWCAGQDRGACFSDRTPIAAWPGHTQHTPSTWPVPAGADAWPLSLFNQDRVLEALDQRARESHD